MPDASILIPCFRAEHTLARAIASLQAQTLKNWEAIIISDDGVDYEAVLKSQSIEDKRLRFTGSQAYQSGPGAARNAGLRLAGARYIATLDADDEFLPTRLALLLPMATRYGAASTAIAYGKRSAAGGWEPQPTLNALPKAGPLCPRSFIDAHLRAASTICFDRTRIPEQWPEEIHAFEDIILALRFYNYVPNIFYTPKPLYLYHRQENSLVHASDAPMRMRAIKEELRAKHKKQALRIENPEASCALHDYLQVALETESMLLAPGRAKDDYMQLFRKFWRGRKAPRRMLPLPTTCPTSCLSNAKETS